MRKFLSFVLAMLLGAAVGTGIDQAYSAVTTTAAANPVNNIVGGSIDNTPIGATTPSTGAFTTLTATGNVVAGDSLRQSKASATMYETLSLTNGTSGVAAGAYTIYTAGTNAYYTYVFSQGYTTSNQYVQNGVLLETAGAGGINLSGHSATGPVKVWNNDVLTATFSTSGLQIAQGALGYATGVGGTVTQATSKATAATCSKVTCEITMNAAALAASTTVSFTLTNTTLAAADQFVCTHHSGGTIGAYTVTAFPAAGSATVALRNVTAGSLSEAVVLKCNVYKSATS